MFNDFLRFVPMENAGSFLSMGDSLPQSIRDILFLGIVPLMLIGFAAYFLFHREIGIGKVVAAGLFVGGGLGNLIDRIFNDGRVYDFLNLGVGGVRTGIFNVADIFLMFAMAYLVFASDKPTVTDSENSL